MSTSNSDISPRPWKVSGNYLVMDADSNSIAMFDGEYNDIDAANAAHAVACVNACEGMDPADVRGMAERLQEAERIIGRMLCIMKPSSQAYRNAFGGYRADILERFAEAQRFLESNQ